jgi:uncharacterized protein (TIGR00255 family)
MAASMTGYGRAKRESENFAVTVEIKSVNHRFCEISTRMPRQLMVLEDKIKKAIMEYVNRGRIDIYITIEGEGLVQRSVQVDWQLLDQFVEVLHQAKERYSVSEEISFSQLFTLEDVLTVIEKESDHIELQELIIDAVHGAAKELFLMRQMEGKQLIEDIYKQLEGIEQSLMIIRQQAPKVSESYRDRIEKKVKEYITGAIDENRILTEVVLFADKADINEELARLQSHISQFKDTMTKAGVIGRKLDFLVQEMNREINTIGSKASDAAIAQQVVEVKSLLEKIKEQVQNIE